MMKRFLVLTFALAAACAALAPAASARIIELGSVADAASLNCPGTTESPCVAAVRMTGYQGRIGIYETMVMTPELRKAVMPETDLAALRDLAYREGMRPLRIAGAAKVAVGITTVDEVLQTAPPPSGDRRQHPR